MSSNYSHDLSTKQQCILTRLQEVASAPGGKAASPLRVATGGDASCGALRPSPPLAAFPPGGRLGLWVEGIAARQAG